MRARHKKPAHRPRINIDWNFVDESLILGCFGTEIALMLGIDNDTLYSRCEQEKQMCFSDYSAQKKAKRHRMLRDKQFARAMKEDTTMLIWLGKQELDQREPESKTVEACRPALLEYLDRLMKS